MLPEHEHLLRENISYFLAYSHQWRDEKAEHAREIAEGYREARPSEEEEFRRDDYRTRVRDLR